MAGRKRSNKRDIPYSAEDVECSICWTIFMGPHAIEFHSFEDHPSGVSTWAACPECEAVIQGIMEREQLGFLRALSVLKGRLERGEWEPARQLRKPRRPRVRRVNEKALLDLFLGPQEPE